MPWQPKDYRLLKGPGGVQGEGGEPTLGNPKDSVWEDLGTEQGRLGESPPGTLKNPKGTLLRCLFFFVFWAPQGSMMVMDLCVMIPF